MSSAIAAQAGRTTKRASLKAFAGSHNGPGDRTAHRQRAYELWLSAGKPEGSHLLFWKEAEQQTVGPTPKAELNKPNDK